MDAMKYWRLGLVAVALEEYIDAISLLTEAISIDSTKVIFFVTRGTTYAKNKDYAAGIGDFQLASTMRGYSQTAEILVQIARCRLHLGSPSMALLALRDALSLEPSDTDALTLRRRVLDLNTHMEGYRGARIRKHWHTARSSYELCLQVYAEEDSDPPVEIQCWDIELSIVKGSWDAAIAAVDHLLLEKPKEIQAMTLRALVLLLTGRLLQGLDQINAVLRFDPDNQPAKELRSRIKGVIRLKEDGNALFGEKQWNAAIGKWSDALELVNDKEEEGKGGRMRAILLLNRAIARSKLGQFSEGLSDINGTLGLDPSYFKAFLVRGRIYVGLELYESAAQDFKVALEHSVSLEPADVRALKDELDKAEEMVARERNQVKDYYKILGLSRNCTAAELRKAYHKQSLKHHPNKGGLEEKFKLVNEAYAILSDETARRDYDEKKEKNED
ncbi:hypothetical protein AcW1_001447 [Taiwanofungus camphoratus]|nr:hypothetical protein AcW1_001447 [Antrodia cinnamomea]